MKTIIKEDDYEEYEFDYLTIVKKYGYGLKMTSGLYKELERVHPCFSEDFTFVKRKLIRKSRIIICVTVMNKKTLSEYDKNKKLYIHVKERNRCIPVFNKSFENRIIYSSCVVIMIISSFLFMFTNKNTLFADDVKTKEIIEISSHEESKKSILPIIITDLEKIKIISIEGFDYQVLENKEKIIFHFKNVYSDSIVNLMNDLAKNNKIDYYISETNYKKNIPYISVELTNELKTNYPYEEKLTTTIRQDIVQQIGLLKKEEQDTIFFEISKNNIWTLLNKVYEKNLIINQITVNDNLTKYDVSLKVTSSNNNICCGVDAESVKKVFGLFENNFIASEKKGNKELKVDGQLIGKVVTKNGQCVSFYKDSNGKIVSSIQK